jgi:hypothetical protein
MEPMRPEVREELKRAHPGLTDDDIDRYEELLSRRFAFADEDAEGVRALDLQRERLVRERMPHLEAVENAVLTRLREVSRRPKPPPDVRLRDEHDSAP